LKGNTGVNKRYNDESWNEDSLSLPKYKETEAAGKARRSARAYWDEFDA
jgi:hypothetical protein